MSKAWDRWKNYYTGNYNPQKQVIPMNMTFANGKIMVPKCYFRNPKVKVTPSQPQHFYSAFVVDSVINQLVRELRLKYQIKAMIEDAFFTGSSFMKLGFDSQYGYMPENEELDTQTKMVKGEEEKLEYDVNIKNGMPWGKWCDADDLVVPWGSQKSGDPEISDVPWVAHRFVRMHDDILDDKRYKKKAVDQLGGTYKPQSDINKGKFGEDVLYDELWEVRDVKRKKLYVVSNDVDDYLLETDDELQIEGLPFTRLMFNAHPKYFWGISDVGIIEPHQLALNVANTIFNYHIRLALKKFVAQSKAVKNPEA
ncbi:MAG: hypothetical protein GY706_02120, partial [Bacteroides sp.]|nr:hypothetical protein [Bacteroides sp.]